MPAIRRSLSPSVKTLVILPSLIIVLFVALIAYWLINREMGEQLNANEIAMITSYVDEIAALSNTGIPLPDFQRQIMIKAATPHIGVILVTVGDVPTIVTASKRHLLNQPLADLADKTLVRDITAALAHASPVNTQVQHGTDVTFIRTQVINPTFAPNGLQKSAIAVTYSLEAARLKTRATAHTIVMMFLVSLGGIFLLFYQLLSHWIVTPLRLLTHSIEERRTAPHPRPVVLTQTAREIATINTALTHLFRIQESAQKAYISYVTKLEQSENKLLSIVNSAMDGVISVNEDQIIIVFNQAAEGIFGYSARDILGQRLDVLIPAHQHQAHRNHLARYRDQAPDDERRPIRQREPVTGITANGREITLDVSVSKTRVDGKIIFTALVRDITTQLKDKERIYNLAFFDQLTGLPNKEHFTDLLRERLQTRADSPHSVLYISLNGLKVINDALGHKFGDSAICIAAGVIATALTSGKSAAAHTLARADGNKLMVLLESTTAAQAQIQAAAIVASLQGTGGDEKSIAMKLSANIGIASYPAPGQTAEQLIQQSHMAMDRAKESGQFASLIYEPSISVDIQARLKIEAHLHRALSNGEFSLHYQPKFETCSQRITGCEALLRWHNPELGPLGPDVFIPLAEKNRDIIAIGAWVLERACTDIQRINQRFDLQLQVAVNVSVVQFMCDNLLDTIGQALTRSGLPAALLTIEMTESLFLENPEHIRTTINALHELGASLSIDDFGTGYSSLSYLKSLDIDELKIDQAFTRDLPQQSAIVTAMLDVAKGFDLNVVAEGIETQAQLLWLQQAGCNAGQGYLFSRPLSVDDFTAFVEQRLYTAP